MGHTINGKQLSDDQSIAYDVDLFRKTACFVARKTAIIVSELPNSGIAAHRSAPASIDSLPPELSRASSSVTLDAVEARVGSGSLSRPPIDLFQVLLILVFFLGCFCGFFFLMFSFFRPKGIFT